jgi:hypothetical protein
MDTLNNTPKLEVMLSNEHTHFQVSSELIASKNFHGNEALIIMQAITTGDYEPCVQSMALIQKQLRLEHLTTLEHYTRFDFKDYDEGQRVDRVLMQLRSLPKNIE